MRLARLAIPLLSLALAAASGCAGEWSCAEESCAEESCAEESCAEESLADLDEGDDELGAAGSAIVDGAIDEGHPAVVALTVDGMAFCSGTLVTPTVVVTAAHCLHQDFVGDLASGDVRVFFGTDITGPGVFIAVVEARLHPDFRSDDPEQDDDVALLRLAAEAQVEPLAMGPSPEKGDRLALVGFGRADADVAETGVKRVGSSTVRQTTARLLIMRAEPHGTCNGDSGGAAIATIDGVETFVGIHTRSDCRTGMIDERVDAHQDDFIQPFIDAGCSDCAPARPAEEAPEDDDADQERADQEELDQDAVAGGEAMPGCSVGPASGGDAGLGLAAALVALVATRRRARPALRSATDARPGRRSDRL